MSRRSVAQGNGDPAQERRALEDAAAGGRAMEDPSAALLPLSDSENEEPFPRRTLHRSAFVSKTNLPPLTSWSLQSKLERSQSCSEHVTESPPGRRRAPQPQESLPGRRRAPQLHDSLPGHRRAPQPQKAKVAPRVLLSTENSRSFSAPVLTSEKRVVTNSFNSFTPLHKPERSISPESNDSISEELNHFKPIVCSPCTPPKRLPDGRVLSPVIVKSTPRNLRRNLQKPTTYEASPVILKKWEQVFQDRQRKRTLSKGTLTTPAEVGGPEPSAKEVSDLELIPSSSKEETPLPGSDGRPQPLPCSGCLRDFSANTKTRLAARLTLSQCKCLGAKPVKRAHQRKGAQPMGLPNGASFTTAENISPGCALRRGQKRRCKTKHLEKNGAIKRLRAASRGGGLQRLWREAEKKLRQEEEDKKLALKLQQVFDKERRRVSRGKGSRDEYPLRSKSTAGAS